MTTKLSCMSTYHHGNVWSTHNLRRRQDRLTGETGRNLGVQMDQHLTKGLKFLDLTMAPQATASCVACNFLLHRPSSIRRYLTVLATRSAVEALTTSRLDYCNSLRVYTSQLHKSVGVSRSRTKQQGWCPFCPRVNVSRGCYVNYTGSQSGVV